MLMVSKQRQLLCDECGNAFIVNDGWVSTVKLRKDARRAGWRRSDGRDLCQECFAVVVRARFTHVFARTRGKKPKT